MTVAQETVDYSVQTRAVGKHLLALVQEGKKMAADGKVTFDEVPEALAVIIKDLIPAIAAVAVIPAEEKENLGAFLDAAYLSVRDVVVELAKP